MKHRELRDLILTLLNKPLNNKLESSTDGKTFTNIFLGGLKPYSKQEIKFLQKYKDFKIEQDPKTGLEYLDISIRDTQGRFVGKQRIDYDNDKLSIASYTHGNSWMSSSPKSGEPVFISTLPSDAVLINQLTGSITSSSIYNDNRQDVYMNLKRAYPKANIIKLSLLDLLNIMNLN